MYRRFLKRILDIFGAVFLLMLLSPLLLLISLILVFTNKGRVFFAQTRPGKDDVPFRLYKFRTFTEQDDEVLAGIEKLSFVGSILRKTSLDELPQLVNVLEGKMSIIGPRPLLMEYLPLYSDFQRKRHSVLPGITGWAQVKGRNSLAWPERFKLDVFYTENISFILDLKIVWLTVFKIISGKDVYDEKGQMVEKFKGNNTL